MKVPIIWSWYIPEDFEKAEFHRDFRSIASKSLFWFKIFLIRMKNVFIKEIQKCHTGLCRGMTEGMRM